MNKSVGVVGIGSPEGSDNIAQHVIQLLKNNLKKNLKNKIQLEYYDRPGIYLLECIKHFDIVHIIDAIISDKPLGAIHRYEDISILRSQKIVLSSHGMGVSEALLLGEILNCLPSKIIIHGIEISNDKHICAIPDEIINASYKLAFDIINELGE